MSHIATLEVMTGGEPTADDLAAASRGALVPSVAMWKWRTGQQQTPIEQAFQWGYVHGHDDCLAAYSIRLPEPLE